MKKRNIGVLACLLWGMAGMAHAAPQVIFDVTDKPGSWFECANTATPSNSATGGCVPAALAGTAGQKSLAVILPGETIGFASTGQASTLHTAVSLMYPSGAPGATDFDVDLLPPLLGGSPAPQTVTLTTPGLYVFFCDIHPYMFAAVIVDNSATVVTGSTLGLDLGTTVDLPHVTAGGLTNIPTASDLVLRLVHAFFIITNSDNWQHFPKHGTASWSPSYPPVPVLASSTGASQDVALIDLNAFLGPYFSEPKTLSAPVHPSHPGVGQIWVDTQFETVAEKTKPGTATAVNAHNFNVERKVALPQINMNNPHNMWTDRDQKLIYQTEWFDNYLTVFDRITGKLERRVHVGLAPAHVMTRPTDDYVHVSQNGDNHIVELFPGATSINQFITIEGTGDSTHPHAHWMSADGTMMVTPNEDEETSTLYDFPTTNQSRAIVGHSPIATGMMPDSSKYYVANFLDSTITRINIVPGSPSTVGATKTIELLLRSDAHGYDPIGGCTSPANIAHDCSLIGALPIQTPVSPDGKYVVSANTLTATLTFIDTSTDTVVAMLPCDPGCHGVQFGAKKGGGYYAYVSSKFSNRMLVVDMDGTATGGGTIGCGKGFPCIAGSFLVSHENVHAGAHSDGTVIANAGMGGQGVLPIPLVYNGWVQNLPHGWKSQLTKKQQTATP